MDTDQPTQHCAKGRCSWGKVIFVVVILTLVVCIIVLPVGDWIASFLSWVAGIGLWGPILLCLFYIPHALLFLPSASTLHAACGFLFGLGVGVCTAFIGYGLGTSSGFCAGATIAKKWVQRKLESSQKLRVLEQALSERGPKVVALCRFSVVFPASLINCELLLPCTV